MNIKLCGCSFQENLGCGLPRAKIFDVAWELGALGGSLGSLSGSPQALSEPNN